MAVPAVPAGGRAGRHSAAVAQFDSAGGHRTSTSARRPAWTRRSGAFQLGLAEPTVTIQDFKLYNPPSFGGTPFLDIPEIHVEYDRAALAQTRDSRHAAALQPRRTGHREKRGRPDEYFFARRAAAAAKKSGGGRRGESSQRQTGFEFTGIDVLNVSVGTAKYIDLKDQRNNREQKIGLENW